MKTVRFEPAPTFQQLVDAWYDQLYRFALGLSGDGEEARELTRRTFAQWAQPHPVSGETAEARSWLFAALHREFLRVHGLAGGSPTPADDARPDHLPSGHGFPPGSARRDEFLAALQEIDPASRASLALYLWILDPPRCT